VEVEAAGMSVPADAPRGLRAARWYVTNWHARVVPVVPGSRAAVFGSTGRGHERASDDPNTIMDWWTRWPWVDAALLTTDRLVLLDADTKHGIDGRDTRRDLEERYGALPDAPTTTTPHGGEHRYFAAPPGGVRSSVAKLGAGLDVRGNASLVYPPPCRGYAYLIGFAANDVPLPELPARWVDAIRRLDEARGEPGEPFRLPDFVGKGERNDTLFRYASSMRARLVEFAMLCGAVRRANRERCSPPLKDREVDAILASVETYPAGRQAA